MTLFSQTFWRPEKPIRRSLWLRGLMCRSAAVRCLGLRVQIPPGGGGGGWMSVLWMLCVLSGRGLYDGPIRRPECGVSMYDLRTWTRKRPRLEKGCCAQEKERRKNKKPGTSIPIRWLNWTSGAVSLLWMHSGTCSDHIVQGHQLVKMKFSILPVALHAALRCSKLLTNRTVINAPTAGRLRNSFQLS